METKIFISAAFIAVIYMISMTVFNLLLGQYLLAGVIFFASGLILGYYLIARRRTEFTTGINFLSLMAYPVLAFNFYYNDGVNGPTFFIFLMVLSIIICVQNKESYWFWGSYNLLFFIILAYIGIFHPHQIPTNYPDEEIRFMDITITYLFCLLSIIGIISALKWNYLQQKEISEQKGLALKKANKELSRSNLQKNKIIALISHDLKSPLLSITNVLEIMNEGQLDPEEETAVKKELLIMASNAQKLTEEILEWATVELKNDLPQFKMVDIRKKFQTIMQTYSSLAQQKGLSLNISFEGSTVIPADIDRLLLIIRNLLQNAIKFTPKGGQIQFIFKNNEQGIFIIITDNGTGIAKEKLGKLFEMNFSSSPGTAEEKGTGLGLYISNENAKRIGASLLVESELDEGSTFTLKLPKRPVSH